MQQALIEIIVLFIIMGCGLILGKKNLIDKNMSDKLSTLVLSFTFPALIIASMDRDFDIEMFKNSAVLVVFAVAVSAAITAAIEIETKIRKKPPENMSARHFLMLFGNTSFMGIPVLSALYGSNGVFYAAVMNVVFNFLMFSYGVFLLCRKEHPNFKKIFFNSGFIGTLIGFVLFVTPLSLPYIISRPVSWCGDMTIPLALLAAGSIMSRNKLTDIIKPASVWYTSFIRIVLYPIILIPILLGLGVSHYLISVIVIIFATPAPLTAGAFVGNYGGDDFFAGKVVVLSNLLSLATMPVLIYIFTTLIV